MSRLWPDGEPITIVVDTWSRPVRFIWQGRTHRIREIHQQWQVDTDWWHEDGPASRNYFTLTTIGGLLCVIYHDQLAQEWRLAKVYD